MLLVSHDFGVIAQACDRVAVMYGGHIVETGPVETIYHEPEHPYTRALLNSVPELDSAGNVQRRAALAGHPPELSDVIPGCVFAPRCEHARPAAERLDEAARRSARPRVRLPGPSLRGAGRKRSAIRAGWKRERRIPAQATRKRRLLEVEAGQGIRPAPRRAPSS